MIEIDLLYNTVVWIVLISLIYIGLHIKKTIRYPPGPFNIPLFGYLPFFLAKHPHEYLADLRKKYGNLFGFRIGKHYILVINDYSTLKDLIGRDEFLDRPNISPFTKYQENSLIRSSGDVFKREKRISMRILHKLAFEQKVFENVVREEISYLMKQFEEYENIPCDVRDFLKTSAVNNVASLWFGQRYHHGHYRTRNLVKGIDLFEKLYSNGDPTIFFPILEPLMKLFRGTNYKKCLQWSELLDSVIGKELEEHKQKELNEDDVRDYLDAYLLELKKPNSLHSETALMGNSKVFFIGGTTTTSSALEWFMIAMANNQDIQSRCFEEIKEAIGLEKPVEYSDMKILPYVRAAILETLRWRTLAPLGAVRSISKDVEYNGYILPKNAFVFANIWAVHNDPSHWKKPNEFSLENFLDQEGNIINTEYCIPYCIGRRACPGENIANVEIFLYVVSMLQKYSFHPPDNEKLCTEGVSHIIYYSKPFKIIFRPRQ